MSSGEQKTDNNAEQKNPEEMSSGEQKREKITAIDAERHSEKVTWSGLSTFHFGS